MIVVQGHIKFADGDIERMQDAMKAQLEATNAEDGCLLYAFSRDVLDPSIIRISERWRDGAALAAHGASPHMKTFNKAMGGATILDISVKSWDGDNEKTLIGK
ncbi:MAG: antibiotic biosynthesis monooxygenase [Sphingomonadales bacterium]|jgi:quinol monooxygenase YgiN|nr:antibiotic biosynthesis monooxygenase [Sphingomonadales bacterium]